jgi:hypothetical protein
MSQEALGRLIDRWSSDASFREEVRADPLAAIERAGVALSPEQTAAIEAIDWTLSDRALVERASRLIPI